MFDVGFEASMELVLVVVYGVGTIALTGIGLVAEWIGVGSLVGGGVSVSALWLVAVGGVLVYAGVGYCGQELRAVLASDTT